MINILAVVKEFYGLEAVESLLVDPKKNNFEPFRHSHEKWYRDFKKYKNIYTNKLANAIYDYTVIAVAGEMRHARSHSTHSFLDFPTSTKERCEVYLDSRQWNGNDILNAGAQIFNPDINHWSSAYGGFKWMLIAKGGLLRKQLNDSAFIDHCVDLSHNNSVYFDKGADIFFMETTDGYNEFLDVKRYKSPEQILSRGFGRIFVSLVNRAITLNIIDRNSVHFDFLKEKEYENYRDDSYNIVKIATIAEDELLDYTPIVWGNTPFNFKIVDKNYFSALEKEKKEKIVKDTNLKYNYKIGDKVKIVKNINDHEFSIGEIVKIIEVSTTNVSQKPSNQYLACSLKTGECWEVISEEIELYIKHFSWKAFKSGKIIVNCKTKEKILVFLKECECHNITWCTGQKTSVFIPNLINEPMCIDYNGSGLSYANTKWFKQHTNGKQIISSPFTSKQLVNN